MREVTPAIPFRMCTQHLLSFHHFSSQVNLICGWHLASHRSGSMMAPVSVAICEESKERPLLPSLTRKKKKIMIEDRNKKNFTCSVSRVVKQVWLRVLSRVATGNVGFSLFFLHRLFKVRSAAESHQIKTLCLH